MTLVTTDPKTGLRRGPIRYPDGQPPVPSGCRWCGIEERHHAQRWSDAAEWHTWAAPTDAQILARMLARRRAHGCRCHIPTIDPWKCAADDCAMHDQLLRGWHTPVTDPFDLPTLEVARPRPPDVAHHAFGTWTGSSIDPDDEGDLICLDCNSPACPRFLRIRRRLDRARRRRNRHQPMPF